MPNTLVIGAAQKATGDRVRIACDFGNEPSLIILLTDSDGNYVSTAVGISAYSVSCTGAGAPSVTQIGLEYPYVLSAMFSGGSPGTYDIIFTVTLDDGDGTELERTGTLDNLG